MCVKLVARKVLKARVYLRAKLVQRMASEGGWASTAGSAPKLQQSPSLPAAQWWCPPTPTPRRYEESPGTWRALRKLIRSEG